MTLRADSCMSGSAPLIIPTSTSASPSQPLPHPSQPLPHTATTATTPDYAPIGSSSSIGPGWRTESSTSTSVRVASASMSSSNMDTLLPPPPPPSSSSPASSPSASASSSSSPTTTTTSIHLSRTQPRELLRPQALLQSQPQPQPQPQVNLFQTQTQAQTQSLLHSQTSAGGDGHAGARSSYTLERNQLVPAFREEVQVSDRSRNGDETEDGVAEVDADADAGATTTADQDHGHVRDQEQVESERHQHQHQHQHQPTNDEVEAVIRQATSTRPTPDGRPPPGKDTRTQLFVGNLPYRVRWQDLKDLFRRSGTVLRADVALSPDNRSRGHGTVLLASAEDAGRAMDMFHGYNWQGRVLEVRLDRMGPQLGELGVGVGVSVGVPGVGGVPGAGLGAMGVVDPFAFNAGLYVPSPPHPPSGFAAASGSSVNLPPSSAVAGSSSLPSSLMATAASSMGLTPAQVQVLLQQQQQRVQQQQQQQQEAQQQSQQSQQSLLQGLSLQQVQQLQQQMQMQGKELTNDDVYKLLATLASSSASSSPLASSLGGALNPSTSSSSSSATAFSPDFGGAGGNGNGGVGAGVGSRSTAADFGVGLSALERERLGLTPGAALNGFGERPASGLGGLAGLPALTGLGALGGLGMRSLFVGNLPFHCQWQDLKDLFRQAGTILRADVALGPDGRSRGFGTVSFATEVDAERAVAMFNGYDFNGRLLKVHYDKFSSQTPLPPSSSSSAGLTPIQPTAATLLQAAQLQQLVSASAGSPLSSTGGGFGSGSGVDPFCSSSSRPTSSSGLSSTAVAFGNAPMSATLPLTASLQASVLQQQQQQRRASAGDTGTVLVNSIASLVRSGSGNGNGNGSGSGSGRGRGLSPVSPLNAANAGVIGASPRLARLHQTQQQQQVEQRASATSSRTGSGSGSSGSSSSVLGHGYGAVVQQSASKGSLNSSPTSSSPLRQIHTNSASSSSDVEPSKVVPKASASAQMAQSQLYTQGQGQGQTLDVAPKSRRPSTAASIHSSTSPRASHPAHPGTIALPPPPPANAFPYPHPYPAMGTISPLAHPGSPLLYSAYVQMHSPVHQYPPHPPPHPPGSHGAAPGPTGYGGHVGHVQDGGGAQQQGQGAQMMTPYGLPPITPSMPSFSFVPQPSPASTAVAVGGSSAIPPTPAEGGPHEHATARHNQRQHGNMSSAAAAALASAQGQNASTPMAYPTYNAAAVMGMASPPIHFPPHMFSPLTPGTALSPGAYWGRPGPMGPVGSHPLHHAAYPPGSQPTSPAAGGFFSVMGEPSGYFPPVPPQQQQQQHQQGVRQEYFPPIPHHAQSSGLVNELAYGDRDAGSAVLVDGVDGVDRASERERTRSSSSSFSVQSSSAHGEGDDGRSSSVATSWRSSDERVPTKGTLTAVDTTSTGTLRNAVGEMASLRLGEPPKGKKVAAAARRFSEKGVFVGQVHQQQQQQPYASVVRQGIAAEERERHAAANANTDAVSSAPGQQQNRSHSMGETGSSRPQALQKTHSDETGKQIVARGT